MKLLASYKKHRRKLDNNYLKKSS